MAAMLPTERQYLCHIKNEVKCIVYNSQSLNALDHTLIDMTSMYENGYSDELSTCEEILDRIYSDRNPDRQLDLDQELIIKQWLDGHPEYEKVYDHERKPFTRTAAWFAYQKKRTSSWAGMSEEERNVARQKMSDGWSRRMNRATHTLELPPLQTGAK
jgi:hypothetical protein